jgi:hypothetical protein
LEPPQPLGRVLAAFQSEVVSLHPAAVHILIGLGDADATDDAGFQLAVPEFVANLEAIVQEAKAANIKVVLAAWPLQRRQPASFA